MPNRKSLVLIYIIAFSLGALFIVFSPLPYGDQSDYDIHARNLLRGNGLAINEHSPYFPDVYRTPGTGLFLYAIYSTFGVNYLIVKIIQVLLHAFVPVLIFYLVRRVFNQRFAYIAAVAVAVYPFTTMFVSVVCSETLCIVLFCLGVFLFEKARASERRVYFLFSGITFGYCLLVRPGTALMPVFLTIAYLLVHNFRRVWKFVLIFNLGVLLLWSPWVIRNHMVSGKFIPLTIEGKEMIYWATGSTGKYLENRLDNLKFRAQMSEVTKLLKQSKRQGIDQALFEQELYTKFAIQNIKEEPFKYAIATLYRIPRMWVTYIDTNPSRSYVIAGGSLVIYRLVTILTAISFFLAVYGMWILRHAWKKVIFLAMPIIYFSLTHMVILTEARFTLPGRPFLLIFMLVGLFHILKKICAKFNFHSELLNVNVK